MRGHEGFIAKLKRFDRRLTVEPDAKWGGGVYKIMLTDAMGIRHPVVRRLRGLNDAVFRELFKRSPWKRNQAIHQFEADMEAHNAEIHAENNVPVEVHEEAWERMQYLRRKGKM